MTAVVSERTFTLHCTSNYSSIMQDCGAVSLIRFEWAFYVLPFVNALKTNFNSMLELFQRRRRIQLLLTVGYCAIRIGLIEV